MPRMHEASVPVTVGCFCLSSHALFTFQYIPTVGITLAPQKEKDSVPTYLVGIRVHCVPELKPCTPVCLTCQGTRSTQSNRLDPRDLSSENYLESVPLVLIMALIASSL